MRVSRAKSSSGIVHVTLLFGGDPVCIVPGMSEYGPNKQTLYILQGRVRFRKCDGWVCVACH